MRPLTAEEEATLRRLAERHGFLASRGPHTGEGSTTRLIDALLGDEVITLALTPADRRRLLEWLERQTPSTGRLPTILGSLTTQLRTTLPPPTPARSSSKKQKTAASSSTTTRLSTAEAAARLGLSPGRVQEMARDGEIGRKEGGHWTFSASEITRCKEKRERLDYVWRNPPSSSLTRTRQRPKKRASSRRAASSRRSGRPTKDEWEALNLLDHILAQERAVEQSYDLPFRTPQRIETTIHTCMRCSQDLLFLIFGDQASDAEGLAAYGRLMHDHIVAHGLPAYVLGPPHGDPEGDDTPSLLRQVWPRLGETLVVTPTRWDEMLDRCSQQHCALERP